MTPSVLRIVTWNVLADAYVATHDYYGQCDPRDLEPNLRRARLCGQLPAFGADVLCLQEVDVAAHAAFAAALPGYTGWRLAKGRGKPDGCSTFVRDGWRVSDVAELRYDDDTGCVALTLTLEWDYAPLAITNTHLKWSKRGTPAGEHRGCLQAEQLVAARPPAAAWVVCGDFNAEIGSLVLDRFVGAGLRSVHPESAATCNANQRVRKIDFTLCSADLNAVETPTPVPIEPTTPLPNGSVPSDHLPVETVFEHLQIGRAPDTKVL